MDNHLRSSNKKNKIINSYNSTAHFYDKRYRIIQEKKYTKAIDEHLLTEKIILDIGCGTGLLFEFITKSKICKGNFKSNYIAIDISRKMLRTFMSKLSNLKDKSKVSLLLSDIENLPFRDDIFNLIFSFTSFQNLPNCKRGIQELFRVAIENSDLKFSILKKNRELGILIELLKTHLKNLEINDEESLEDIIIQGEITK